MESKTSAITKSKELKIKLVAGEFTPLKASDVIMSLINQKINYHKREDAQLWERNHNSNPESLNKRINELEEEKIIAQEFISKIRAEGKNLEIEGFLKLKIVD